MGMQIVNKLSAKKVCGTLSKPEKKTAILQVFGIATGIKTGESQFGPWTALTGAFRATRHVDGEVFQSGTCYLPAMGTEMIVPMLKKEGVDGLEFAFNIGIVPSDKPIGYEYYVEPMLEAKENDPLELLAKRVSQAALPAPSADQSERKANVRVSK